MLRDEDMQRCPVLAQTAADAGIHQRGNKLGASSTAHPTVKPLQRSNKNEGILQV